MGHVVATDLHQVDDGRLALGDHPAQVHDRLAVGAGAADDVVAHLRVDIAVVVVQRLELGRGVVPLLLVERRDAPLPRIGLERIEQLQLLGGEAPVAHDFDRADAVRIALAHLHQQRRLPRRVGDDERVVEDLDVDVPALAVELGEPPPEPFGARLHLFGEHLVREPRIALEVDPRDRHAPALVHVEDHADAPGIGVVHAQRAHAREVVALGLVQRVDAAPRALHLRGIDRAARDHLRPVADRVLAQPVHPAHRPMRDDRPLLDLNDQDAGAGRVLVDADVVELP